MCHRGRGGARDRPLQPAEHLSHAWDVRRFPIEQLGKRAIAPVAIDRIDLRVDFHPEPIGELRHIYDWFRPLVPYYQERVIDPYIIREDIWREKKLAERADG